MKKLLIAAAAMSVVAGAQAQSSATLYGTLDVGYGSFATENTGAAKVTQKGLVYNQHDTSRWGIKATEDLGGGMKAGVTIESTAAMGGPKSNFGYSTVAEKASTQTFYLTGTGNTVDAQKLGDRILTVDLTIGAHTINAGNQAQPTRGLVVATQAENSNMVGNLVGNDALLTGRIVAINYTYNAGNGLNVGGAVMNNTKQQDGVTDNKSGNGYALSARYTAGAADAGFVYTKQTTNTSTTTTTATTASSTQLLSPTATLNNETASAETKAWVAAGSYDLGVVRLFAQHSDIKVDNTMNALTGDSERKATSLGLRVPLTAKAWIGAQYSFGKAKIASSTYEGDWTGYGVTARYNFSNRTAAYVGVGESKLDTSATNTTKATQLISGLIHNF